MAASSRPELMHHSLTAASAFMRRVQRRWIGAVRSVWSPATPANRVSSTSPHGLLISQAVRPDRHLTRRQTRTSTKEREKRERERLTPPRHRRPWRRPRRERCRRRRQRLQEPKLPQPRRERGRPPRCGQKSGAAPLGVAALKRRSKQARSQSRPVEAPCAPLPPRGFEPVAFEARGKRIRHCAIQRGTSLHCHPAANIDSARATVLARRRARLLLN